MHSFLNEHTVRRVAGWCALVSLIFAIGMAFEYGRAMSWLHAGTLGLLAIAVPVAFIGADMMRNQGRNIAATLLIVAGTAMSIGEYMTHFGYTVGSRIADTQQTGVQNATYKAAQKNRESEVANLELWKQQLKTLLEQNAWAATVKADGLRKELTTLEERIEAEKKGKRGRKEGCGKECERLQNEANALSARIATAEQANDLSKRIEATQRILDKKVDTAAKTEFHSSKIVNQTAAFAQIAMWTDEPSETSQSWVQLILGAIIAFITTYLTLVFTTVAFGSHKIKPSGNTYDPHHPISDLGNRTPEPSAYLPQPQSMRLQVESLAALRQRLQGMAAA